VAEKGFPGLGIVGLANKAVEEAKERVKTAIINSDFEFPDAKITINLAPADIPKEGACYDLPMAVGILASSQIINLPKSKSYYYGELSLDGGLRHTRGVFLLAVLAKEQGVTDVFVPRLCANEASVVEGVKVFPVDNLAQLIHHLRGDKLIVPLEQVDTQEILTDMVPDFDFSEILGQESAKRAMEIVAAGGHNIFMMGPPGWGSFLQYLNLQRYFPRLVSYKPPLAYRGIQLSPECTY